MFRIRRVSPWVRAIGTMGAVAALAGGITFASLQSNTVALTDNTISVSGASLQLGLTNTGSCSDASTSSQPGMNFSNIVPGDASPSFPFCLKNSGNVPLDLTLQSPTDFSSSPVPASDATLNLTCGSTTTHTTLNNLGTPVAIYSGLASGSSVDCQASVTISNSTTAIGQTITPFELDFAGSSS